ncbi:uncharacterized protein N7477_008709 [Penicillium maclennaniae]|uniref:uncharacterized protein n=1 Tax=Penicillium maclennaniae TaxID=1343394 RepID=UPI00254253A9|nr:uncharacterized protein N7477_008709 [Penicillium maclennaniae]KAJ5666261.1 hypothetical protein N7477_008709 [Penicillium maclennaniae]
MSIQLPGSVLSRTLRSRLIQQRLAKAGSYGLSRNLSLNGSRSYSTEAAEDTLADHEQETSPNLPPKVETNASPEPWKGHKEHFASQRNSNGGMSWSQSASKAERASLMAIASNSKIDGEDPTSRKTLELELKWLADPRALADRVARILQSGDVAKAAALVRQAQREGMSCGVAWNNLLQYFMDRQCSKAAFKLYNDMKKRGRAPNSRTYTIMLTGFRKAAEGTPNVVQDALRVYRSIFAENSPVKPDIIHTNAMLSVCQRHGDMDTLWRIAGELPEEGSQAPDMVTYSTILTAIQFAAQKDVLKMDRSEIEKIIARKSQMVTEGKRIWADVVYRWAKDKVNPLPIDNNVVGSMASLLLQGANDRDFYDIFALYNQTTGIPIFGKIPENNPKIAHRRIWRELERRPTTASGSSVEDDVPFVDQDNNLLKRAKKETLVEEEEEESFDSLFDPIVPDSENLSYLQPNNKDLTMILEACFKMTQGASTGSVYWDYLTKPENPARIEPDNLSYMEYFRLLRLTRSSHTATRVMREQMVPAGLANGKAFHVALSCCRRDRKNRKVLLHANELLDLMNQSCLLPDPRSLGNYLELVQRLCDNPHSLMYLLGLDMDTGRDTRTLQTLGKKLQTKLRLRALATLRPHIAKLHEAMEHGQSGAARKGRWDTDIGELATGQDCARIMAWVRLITDETLKTEFALFVTKEERKVLQSESNTLKKYSDQATIQKLTGKPVKPTVEQRNEFKLRQLELRGPPKTEKRVSETPQEQVAEQPEKQAANDVTEDPSRLSENQVAEQPQEKPQEQAAKEPLVIEKLIEEVADLPKEEATTQSDEVAGRGQDQAEPTMPQGETKS